jgi:hypothetical protein
MTPQEALAEIIRPALQWISLWSPAAEQLVLATFLHESKLKDRRQIISYGPPIEYGLALGLGQMEPETHDDCWRNYLTYRAPIADALRRLTAIVSPIPISAEELVINDLYAAAMCRVKYRRADEPLPAADDLPAMAAYWKRHYNTAGGAGTVDQFLADWHVFMG